MANKANVVAIIGPPNVGKSTLFNTMAGERKAVTSDIAGTTRDRSYEEIKWNGKKFLLIDTGGLTPETSDTLEKEIVAQAQIAIEEAGTIVFVVDGKQPPEASKNTAQLIKRILKSKKHNLIPVVNKIDSPKEKEISEAEFRKIGLGSVLSISANSGRGVGDLMDLITEKLPKIEIEGELSRVYSTVALVGKPNVGKSTLFNQLVGDNRVIASPQAGTTTTAVDTDVVIEDKLFRFIDTAGMKRRSKIKVDIEEFSLFQSMKSIERADVVVLILDAEKKISRFELTIAGKLKEKTKGIIIALNKIDLLTKDEESFIKETLKEYFPFLKFAEVLPISAKTGANVEQLYTLISEVQESRNQKIDEDELKYHFRSWIKKTPPKKLRAQKAPKIYDFIQTRINPPIFELIVNDPMTIHFSYLRYLENQLRSDFGFLGTAIRIKKRKPHK